jgi:hypothetical protein
VAKAFLLSVVILLQIFGLHRNRSAWQNTRRTTLSKECAVDLQLLAREIKDGEWDDLLSAAGSSEVLKISEHEIYGRLVESCGTTGGPVQANCWFDIYWTASWVHALLSAQIEPASTVLEVGAGLSTNFIRAANSLLGSRGRFVTVNLNKRLTDSFKARSRALSIRQRFIEGNARDVHEYLPPASCSFVALNHQINDIVQTIVFESNGRTTDDGDWYGMVPEMVQLIRAAQQSSAMTRVVRPQFLQIIESCVRVLKPGGVIGFNNSVTATLLRYGYDAELLGSFIPLARRWITDGIAGLHEESFVGFHPQWWLFFRNI